jgi:hypothetical protein
MTPKKVASDGSCTDAYEPPELIKYGSIEDLTGDLGGAGDDGLTGSQLA